jgi:alkylation response protein AidB-like acyl-CoA dehydrogenase
MTIAAPPELDADEVVAGIRAFIHAEVVPLEGQHRERLEASEAIDAEVFELCRHVQSRAVAAGYHAMFAPVRDGGSDASEYLMCRVREEVARHDSRITFLMLGDLPFGPNKMLIELVSEAQRHRWLRPLVAGELTTGIAITEPGAGSDVTGIRTVLVPCPGGWRLTGTKHFITNAPYADYLQVLARDAAGGFTMVIVEQGDYRVAERQTTMAGDDLQAEVIFDDVFVPADHVIGRAGEGLDHTVAFLAGERLAMASVAIGMAQRALDLAWDYAHTRRTFGRLLIENQAIQWMLADSETELRAARALCHEVARATDLGADVFRDSSMAKLYATEAAGRIVDRALQVFGGTGYMRGVPIERLYRMARVLRIAGGTSEMQRLLIARSRP